MYTFFFSVGWGKTTVFSRKAKRWDVRTEIDVSCGYALGLESRKIEETFHVESLHCDLNTFLVA